MFSVTTLRQEKCLKPQKSEDIRNFILSSPRTPEGERTESVARDV